jgi:hypothetical protein
MPFSVLCLNRGDFSSPGNLRALLCAFDGINVVSGWGLDNDAATSVAAAAVDAVILIVLKGHTLRSDLERAKIEVERSGGTIAGSFLMNGRAFSRMT